MVHVNHPPIAVMLKNRIIRSMMKLSILFRKKTAEATSFESYATAATHFKKELNFNLD